MAEQGTVRIERIGDEVDVEGLRALFASRGVTVTVTEVSPGPQASWDLFLPPVVSFIVNFPAAHPFISAWLGPVAGKITWETGRKLIDKVKDKAVDVAMEETIKKIGEEILHVFGGAKDKGVFVVRGKQKIDVPPLRFTIDIYNPKVSKQGALALVFPANLTDDDVREAVSKVGKVILAALKRDEKRGRYEERVRRYTEKGERSKATALMLDEKAVPLHRTELTYAFRPDERAWVDALVLSSQGYKEKRISGFKRMLSKPGRDGLSMRVLRKVIAEMERTIREARVR